MFSYKAHSVFPPVNLFSHPSLVMVQRIRWTVIGLFFVVVVGVTAPCLARFSAFLFPGIPCWVGIHCRVTNFPYSLYSLYGPR